ncbi:GntR family transcriptional regulator [Microbacterium sp. ISL-59]|uniref:GntR family transcriptional regulator n=1 Tax=Microbacterium sp. ISL-59 TaxID=2819159 RepID=UPI001BE8FB81|nr:GntR family transcriptional regulator [Microbacterium sp. ISL-59]MBT2495826.1 GntR family transcriptional regulator [Microbacterium sp. ISL-59]
MEASLDARPHTRPRSLIRDQVFDDLAEAIISGHLPPFAEIKDQDLQVAYGISRTPLREALLRLVDVGLVEIGDDRVPHVAPVDLSAQAERAEAAAALISYCAWVACPVYTDEQIDVLRDCIDDLLAFDLTRSGMRDGLRLWWAYWVSVVDAAENRIMLDDLNGRLALHLSRLVLTHPIAPELAAFHENTLRGMREAIESRDGARLRDLIVELFMTASVVPMRAAAASLR